LGDDGFDLDPLEETLSSVVLGERADLGYGGN
jgi:hypothetical protein